MLFLVFPRHGLQHFKNYIKGYKYIKLYNWSNQIEKALSKNDLFVLPSLYEGSPNILLDSLNIPQWIINFLKEKLDSQNDYSSKFSEILQNMEIFQTEENDEKNDDNH